MADVSGKTIIPAIQPPVTLSPGVRLGPYEVTAQIGAGGMGEVYRARDTHLDRDVAIKVLPAALAHDSERAARLEREARMLAALNHPNIAAVYGLEKSTSAQALVMELVEGPTLADRLARGAIPVEESLAIARQMADALVAAHEQGITHRDFKPANVKVRHDGTVKVLDFGLAKAIEPGLGTGDPGLADQAPSMSPTITTPAMTMAGVILGTAAYMSPEQARGQRVDKRADIWAFGIVLYEMLTGHRLFEGKTISDTLASVLKTDPDWRPIPARVRPLLRACLEKDVTRRLRDIGDAWRLLDSPEQVVTAQSTVPWAVAALFAVAAAIAFWGPWRAVPVAPEVARLQLALPQGVTLSAASPFAISPDGRKLVFLAIGANNVSRLWLRYFDSLEARPLPGTETGPTTPSPFWSPDGQSIAFMSGGKLKRVDVNDGTVQVICDLPQVAPGGSWNRAGIIILAQATRGIMRVPASGGALEQLTAVDASRQEATHNNPVFLPDGRHFLYLRNSRDPERMGIYVGALDSSPKDQSVQRLINTSLSADYAPGPTSRPGYILFRRGETLLAQPFDADTLTLSGDSKVVAEQLSSYFSGGLFSVSTTGVLVYRAGDAARSSRLILLDRQGNKIAEPGELGAYSSVDLSPDGTRAVVRRTDYGAQDLNLWLVDLAGGGGRRLTSQLVSATTPAWSPDGSTITYSNKGRQAMDLYRLTVNTDTDAELLLETDFDKNPDSWSPDGKYLMYRTRDPKTGNDLWVLPLVGERIPVPFANGLSSEVEGRFSPDGHWVAYVSTDSGHDDIYVRAFSPDARNGSTGVGDIHVVSRGGGTRPRWSGDGRELFYIGPNGNMMSVDIAPGAAFRAGPPKVLFQLPQGTALSDTAPDGRTLAVVPLESGAQAPFNVVLNWQSALRQ
jgi:Tol biopolymer transport system component